MARMDKRGLIMPSIKYEDTEIRYRISRKAKKNISLRIKSIDDILISAPYHISEKQIEEIVSMRAKWILSKLDIIKTRGKVERLYQEGEIFLYLGKEYILKYRKNSEVKNLRVLIEERFLLIEFSDEKLLIGENIKIALINWYKRQGEKIIKSRMKYFSEELGLNPKQVNIRGLKANWGLCYGNGNISMSLKLIGAPIEVIDYVAVHEICHLEHHNHSKRYWDFVSKYMPDYKERSNWLNENGYRLEI